MKAGKGAKIFDTVFATVLFFVAALVLFWRVPEAVGRAETPYCCVFESGKEEYLSCAEAFALYKGAGRDEILLERAGEKGRVRASAGYSACMDGLSSGDVLKLFAARSEGLSGLEKMALYERFHDTGYYLDGFFVWDGDRVMPAEKGEFREVYLVSGTIRKGILADTGAERLVVKSSAELKASALLGSAVNEIEAEAPYRVKGGAVYRETAGGLRLIAALPNVEELEIDCDFLDEGALSPCVRLKRLKLPATYEGTLKMLFGEMPIPEGLELV